MIDFPATPTNGQEFTDGNGVLWTYVDVGWIANNGSGGGSGGSFVTNFDDLTDVVLTASVAGQTVIFDGTYWRNNWISATNSPAFTVGTGVAGADAHLILNAGGTGTDDTCALAFRHGGADKFVLGSVYNSANADYEFTILDYTEGVQRYLFRVSPSDTITLYHKPTATTNPKAFEIDAAGGQVFYHLNGNLAFFVQANVLNGMSLTMGQGGLDMSQRNIAKCQNLEVVTINGGPALNLQSRLTAIENAIIALGGTL